MPGVIDQEIDPEIILRQPCEKLIGSLLIAQVQAVDEHIQGRKSPPQLGFEFLQPFDPARDENQRMGIRSKLPGKFLANSCRCAGDQSCATLEKVHNECSL